MADRPILFSGPMVRALLDGRKTQTRRAVKRRRGLPIDFVGGVGDIDDPTCWGFEDVETGQLWLLKDDFDDTSTRQIPCPYGQPGDRLWVREAFRPIYPQNPNYNGGQPIEFDYREGYKLGNRMGDHYEAPKWKPSIHMPRRASRITLEITRVRVERLQEISEADAIAEGSYLDRCPCMPRCDDKSPVQSAFQLQECHIHGAEYRYLWEQINGSGSWAQNPFVWVISFRRIV